MDADTLLNIGRCFFQLFHNSSSKSLMHAGRTCKRLHGLVCDREVWVHLLQGIENFSMEKVDELARFGSNGSPEMKAEVVKALSSANLDLILDRKFFQTSLLVSVSVFVKVTQNNTNIEAAMLSIKSPCSLNIVQNPTQAIVRKAEM